MVKRRLKRVLATVIVMTMVAGMNLTVFAEEGGSNANNSTGTVSGNAVEKEEPKKEEKTEEKIDVSEIYLIFYLHLFEISHNNQQIHPLNTCYSTFHTNWHFLINSDTDGKGRRKVQILFYP